MSHASIRFLLCALLICCAAPMLSQQAASTGTSNAINANSAVTGAGTADYIPMWDSTTDIVNSVIFQKSSKIGIATTTPAATLDVNGKTDVRDTLTLFPMSTDSALAVNGTSFKISSAGLVTFISGQTFPGMGTITGITTASGSGLSGGGTSGTLSLKVPSAGITNAMLSKSKITLNANSAGGLTTPGAMTLGSTYTIGLKACSSGQILQYSGTAWTCATASGTGSITGVTAGTDLTGGGTSGTVKLNVDTTKVPQLAAANTFTGNQTVNGSVSATNGFNIGTDPIAFGTYAKQNAFVGFAGNSVMTATGNVAGGYQALGSNSQGGDNVAFGTKALYSNVGDTTNDGWGNTAVGYYALEANNDSDGSGTNLASWNVAVGYYALPANTTGQFNTALGSNALYTNTMGTYNTATGSGALYANVGGWNNTADGLNALASNTSGSYNTAVGMMALFSNLTGTELSCLGYDCNASADGLKNATAIGAHAVVAQSNSLVLGGTGEHAVKVGIGTTTPSNILTIGRGSGPPLSDSWETYSSRRWKTNIQTLQGALAKVEQLRGTSYDQKDSGKHEIGVIAEEVGAVLPEVVSWESNGTDARGVDYGRLTALLIEATKEQQALIVRQQNQIREQQAQIDRLSSQVNVIEAGLKANGSD